MNFGRKQFHKNGKKYAFEKDKGIFVITSKHLVNRDRITDTDGPVEINIPLPLRAYTAGKYSVLLLGKCGKIKFLYNPHGYSEIRDISIEFYEFITKNYDKI